MNIERLSENGKSRRKYDSPTRRDQAEATRARIAEAARRTFIERGWTATRVRDVAAEAGVSEATVFAIHGNKAGLAKALVESVDLTADIPRLISELKSAEGDPAAQMSAMVGMDRRLFERGGDVLTLMQEARRSEPEVAAAYLEGRARGDESRRRMFATWPENEFRDGVTAESARDMYAALCNIDVYRVLTEERGWDADRVEQWWRETLVRLLVAEDG
ncbi:TetR/AcrR family transcriptional regulator [Aeromicrobium sp.]|uniref:TetR/AcrR family transcriptional regulator n=1 Tax=Aeromicrobium sp. TaxID=1871063 RepID=UPI003D6B3E12